MHRRSATLMATAALFGATSARAQVATEWQATIGAGVGVTDNIANTPPPEDGDAGAAEPVADAFANLTPGLSFVFETPSVTHALSYGFGLNLYLAHPDATAYSNSLVYGLRAPLGPRTELSLGLGGSQSTLSVFNLAGPARATPVDASRGGDDILVTATASEGLRHELGPTWSLGQGLAVTTARTLVSGGSDLENYVASATLGLTKELRRDELGGDLSSDTMILPRGGGPGAEDATQILNAHQASLRWRHAFSDDWSSNLAAGAILAYVATGAIEPFVHPAGSASVDYLSPRGSAQLAYAHGSQPNLLLGLITLTDSVSLRAGLPLGASGLDLGGSAAYIATRPSASDGFGPAGHGLTGDLALGWIPREASLRLELRYQIVRQFAPELDPDEESVGIPGLERQTALFTVTFAYPGAPTPGGGGSGVVVPLASPTSNPDLLRTRAPTTERARDDAARDAEREADERRERLGGDGE